MDTWAEYRREYGRLRTAVARLRSGTWTARRRLTVRWYDWRARAAGYCNAAPYSPIPGEGSGGYSDWRCALRRHHDGPHRYRNYVWAEGQRTVYDPVGHYPSQPRRWRRPNVLSRAQQRELDRWHEQQRARILAMGERG